MEVEDNNRQERDIQKVFDDVTSIWENLKVVFSIVTDNPAEKDAKKEGEEKNENVAGNREKCMREICSGISRLENDITAANVSCRVGPDVPIEVLEKDLKEKDELIDKFSKKLDDWSVKVDSLKDDMVETLVGNSFEKDVK